MVGAITVSIMPMMILLSVGALIGGWIIGGTVPAMIMQCGAAGSRCFLCRVGGRHALASLGLGSSGRSPGRWGLA